MDLSIGLNAASKSGGGGGGLSNPFPVIGYSVTYNKRHPSHFRANAIFAISMKSLFTAILPVLKSHLTRISSYLQNPENVRPHSMENSIA